MLRATLDINGTIIGELMIRNTGRHIHDDAGYHGILYRVAWAGDDANIKAVVEHHREHGTRTLVRKALSAIEKNKHNGKAVLETWDETMEWVNGGSE